MAFCGNCGAQLEGDGRFCMKCGADQSAKAGGAPAPAPPSAIPPQAVQPPVAMPPQYPPPPGQFPVVMGMPPAAPAKSYGWLWGVVIVCAILYGLYYIGTHDNQNQTPSQTPTQQPGAPQPQAQPGAPQQQPGAPQQQPGAPQAQPGAPGGGNQALVQEQQFSGRWDGVNGYIQISQAQWKNGSNETMQSATLECVQYAQSGQTITQQQTTLTGPAQPGQTISFNPFQMGQMAQGLAKVQCGIVGVTPAN